MKDSCISNFAGASGVRSDAWGVLRLVLFQVLHSVLGPSELSQRSS